MSSYHDNKWELGYQHLVEFRNAFGHSKVPTKYISSDQYKLGQWVSSQREAYNAKRLSQERYDRLQKLGFVFSVASKRKAPGGESISWTNGYNHLSDYVKEYGNALVPLKYICPDAYNLGSWVHYQRNTYKHGKLSQSRYEKLKKLGFIFEIIKSHNSPDELSYYWLEGYRHLSDYVKKYGNALVDRKTICSDGYKLGNWVNKQRSLYHENALSQARYDKLNELGFVFNHITPGRYPSNEEALCWSKGYDHLCDYVGVHGNTLVPNRYKCPDEYPLGMWVSHQRKLYKTKRLSMNRFDMLKKIGFIFYYMTGSKYRDEETYQWEKGYDHLLEYYTTFGNTHVPAKYCSSDGFSLGIWVESQRNSYKHDRLSQERILLLNKLNFSFLYNTGKLYKVEETTIWKNGFSHLLQYVKTYGDALVPQKYVCEDGFNLGNWVSSRRIQYKLGRLSENQIKLLREIGFIFYVNKGTNHDYEESYRWTQGYTHLLDYVRQFGHAFVPLQYRCTDGFNLGCWVVTKRFDYNSLPLWQIQKLEQVGFRFSNYRTR